ncbi:GntR family transcriptional regulator [Paenibacillus mendelii]|uniref:GntR family transcriptional regulator n=1 Tax=Paenibacillus mendelii TaxID=206163 RepID=A0ABV6J6W0_9BACL|nr:GntR family transcriptional regulator [Paenibacillus mendelii]MCQ6561005.1 GntR family transcriptional regulator [Paenibacillus mendelii]
MRDQEKNTPLYVQIREYIKNQIEMGILKPGDQIPTELELKDQFQVSIMTIKTALRFLVDEGLVFRIAGKGSFVSTGEKQEAKDLLLENKVKIGFLMPPLGDKLSIQLFRGIEESCRDEGLMLMVKSVLTQSEERFAIREMIDAGAEGLIIFPVDGEAYSDEILRLKSDRFPFVLVDRYLPGIKTNAVYSDNYDGGHIGTDYLARKGHKHVGILSLNRSKTSSSEDRFRGYLDAAKKNQLRLEPNYWLTQIDDASLPDENNRKEMIFEWLQNEPTITSVFAFSPETALCAAKMAVKLGKKIPEDLAIICFDNPQIRGLENDYFTWIEQNFELMGTEAVKLLLRSMHDPSTLEQIVIPLSLHEGQST